MMARTAEDIYNSMVTEKQTFASLGGLLPIYNLGGLSPDNPFRKYIDQVNSGSVVAIWIWILWTVANAQHNLEVLWDAMLVEMQAIAASSEYGSILWYGPKVLAWQYGFGLVWNSTQGRYYYADTTSAAAVAARLAARVSAVEVVSANFTGVLIKVAKNTGTADAPVLAQLDSTPGTELDSLTYYVRRIKPAGVQTSVISLPADILKLDIDFYYDGTLDLPTLQPIVIAAINAFLLTGIDFNGTFFTNDFIDAMQAIPGAKDPWIKINAIFAKAASDPSYTQVYDSYDPASGWFSLVPVGNNPLVNSTINFIAK